jgi:flagellar capping protein FliD
MATVVERVGVLEIKVQHVDEKIDDLKTDVREVHDCLDRTGLELKQQLSTMHEASCLQHDTLANKISDLEKTKQKYTMYGMMALAFIAGAGWFDKLDAGIILRFFGL